MSTTWHVRDSARRTLEFEGEKLAQVSSERRHSPRWTEMTLFRTDTGKYVISKVGHTRVLHDPACTSIRGKLNLYVDEYPEGDPEEDNFDLHTCIGDTYYIDEIVVEETRYWAFVSESAKDIVSTLHKTEDGVRSLPRMSANLLEEAAPKDVDIAKAFSVERI